MEIYNIVTHTDKIHYFLPHFNEEICKKRKKSKKLEDTYNYIGSCFSIKFDDNIYIISTYHVGGLCDECFIFNGKELILVKKKFDIPEIDISVFELSNDSDLKKIKVLDEFYFPLINNMVSGTILFFWHNKPKVQRRSCEIEGYRIEYLMNDIYPPIPLIKVNHNFVELQGLSGGLLLYEDKVYGMISGLSSDNKINVIPIFFILHFIKQYLEISNNECSIIPLKLGCCEVELENETFNGLYIKNTFNLIHSLRKFDIIKKIDNLSLDINCDIFMEEIKCSIPFETYCMIKNDTIKFTIIRNDKEIEVKIRPLKLSFITLINPTIKTTEDYYIKELDYDTIMKQKILNKWIQKHVKKLMKNKYGKKVYTLTDYDSLLIPVLQKINGLNVECIDNVIEYIKEKDNVNLKFLLDKNIILNVIVKDGKIVVQNYEMI